MQEESSRFLGSFRYSAKPNENLPLGVVVVYINNQNSDLILAVLRVNCNVYNILIGAAVVSVSLTDRAVAYAFASLRINVQNYSVLRVNLELVGNNGYAVQNDVAGAFVVLLNLCGAECRLARNGLALVDINGILAVSGGLEYLTVISTMIICM